MSQINSLFSQKIAELLRAQFPDIIFSITAVDVSRDLSYAKIWISSLTETETVVENFQKKAPQIQKEMAGAISLRKMPRLHFVADTTSEKAAEIEKLIKKVKSEEGQTG